MDKVYEIVDYTDEDRYYPLGVFASMGDVIEALEKVESEYRPISPWQDEEFETIVVREREMGWSDNGREVMRIDRGDYFNEDNNQYLWKRI